MAKETDTAMPMGMLAVSAGPDGRIDRIQVQTHGGTRSNAHLDAGHVTLSVTGSSDVGREGQEHAVATLVAALSAEGFTPRRLPAVDARGEDAVVTVGPMRYTVQLVTVPPNTTFWRDAAVGSAVTSVEIGSAVQWMHDAVSGKARATSPAERPRTILALDARHAGVLASVEVSRAYLDRHPEPRLEFGFAATWLIGPTASATTQVGTASWSL